MKSVMRVCVLAFLLAVSFPPIIQGQSSKSTAPPSSSEVHQKHTPKKPAKKKKKAGWDGATARCRDGTLSYSAHRRGTCSHHGGVAEWNPDK